MREVSFSDRSISEGFIVAQADLVEDLTLEAKRHLKRLLEGALEEDLALAVGAGRYEREGGRRGYRNGSYTRELVTRLGVIEKLRVPRSREGGIVFRAVDRYKRYMGRIDSVVLELFIKGVSSRGMRGVFERLFGRGVSPQTVSNRLRELEREMAAFQDRPLEDCYEVIILDGAWLTVREVFASRKVLLFAYGIKADGSRELIGYKLAQGESQAAWESFLNGLYMRGLEGGGALIIVHDGAKGIEVALQTVYPKVPTQRCIVHKLRDLLANVRDVKNRRAVAREASLIYEAGTRSESVSLFRNFYERWKSREPKALKCFRDGFEKTLTYFGLPRHMWRAARTTNYLERAFKEIRKRTKSIGAFTNDGSCGRIIYLLTQIINQNLEKMPAYKFTQLY